MSFTLVCLDENGRVALEQNLNMETVYRRTENRELYLYNDRQWINEENHCATLLDNNLGKENVYEIMLNFIVYFDLM